MKERVLPAVMFGILLFGVAALLQWAIIYRLEGDDITAHLQFYSDGVNLPYPLWHIHTDLLARALGLEPALSALVTNALLTSVLYGLMAFFLMEAVPSGRRSEGRWRIWAIAFGLSVLGPYYIPLLSKYMFYGVGSGNVWHNPTMFTVKVFQLLCLVFVSRYFENLKYRHLALAAAAMVLSIYSKPSFAISFLPAVIAYAVLFDRRSMSERLLVPGVLTLVALPNLIFQYSTLFGEHNYRDAGVMLDPFAIWGYYTHSITLSILTALLFPILVSFFLWSHRKKMGAGLKLAWLNLGVALSTYALFAETLNGDISYHGNFAWGYFLSIALLFFASVERLLKEATALPVKWRPVLWGALLGHVFFGVCYILKIVMTGSLS